MTTINGVNEKLREQIAYEIQVFFIKAPINTCKLLADIIVSKYIEELYKDYVSKEEVEMNYVKADFYVMCDWWLKHYEGLEHMLEGGKSSPETMYTITAILGRGFNKLKNGETKAEAFGINSKEDGK